MLNKIHHGKTKERESFYIIGEAHLRKSFLVFAFNQRGGRGGGWWVVQNSLQQAEGQIAPSQCSGCVLHLKRDRIRIYQQWNNIFCVFWLLLADNINCMHKNKLVLTIFLEFLLLASKCRKVITFKLSVIIIEDILEAFLYCSIQHPVPSDYHAACKLSAKYGCLSYQHVRSNISLKGFQLLRFLVQQNMYQRFQAKIFHNIFRTVIYCWQRVLSRPGTSSRPIR